MSLPVLVTPEDVDRIVSYLRTKPAGVSFDQAAAVLSEVLHKRRLNAFIRWRLVKKEGLKFKLDERGWCLARGSKSRHQIMLEILDSEDAYRSALEWMSHQEMDSVTSADVASHWLDHNASEIGTEREKTLLEQALCFFRVAEAAGLGKATIGRRGSPTRLDLNRAATNDFIESEAAEMRPTPAAIQESDVAQKPGEVQQTISPERVRETELRVVLEQPRELRVFLSHGRNLKLVKQVEDILKLVAGIDCEIAINEETTAIPVPEKVFGAMKRCTASVVIVSREQVQGEPNSVRINENVLVEIGAAFMLYDRHVVLLWEKGVPVPSNLQGLYRCEFEGTDLALQEVIKLTRALREVYDVRPKERKAG